MQERWPRFVWTFAALGLILRLAWLWFFPQVIENEGTDYVRLADSLWHGGYDGILGGPQILFPPLYPALIAFVSLLTQDTELAGRLISVVMGTALVFPLALLAGRLAGPRAALIASALVAFHPALVALSAAVLSESCYLTLLFSALYSTSRLCDLPGFRRAVVTGGLFGLAYLTRPEALFLTLAVSLLAMMWFLYSGRSLRFSAGLAATVVVVCSLLALPYVTYLSRASGYLRLEGKSSFITMMNARMSAGMSYNQASYRLEPDKRPDWPMVPDALTLARPSIRETVRPLLTGLLYRIRRCATEMLGNWGVGGPVLLLLALAGVIACRRLAVQHLIVGLAAAMTLVSLLSVWFLFGRYLLAAVPFLLLAAAIGTASIASAFEALAGRRGLRVPAYAALCAVLLAACLVPAVAPTLKNPEFRDARKPFVRDVGRWIASQPASGGARLRIMGQGSAVPFYSNGVLMYLPYTDSKSALTYVAGQRPDYIVLRPDERGGRPYMAAWLAGGISHPCAHLLRKFPVPGYTDPVLVYRWQCSEQRTARMSPSGSAR